MASEILEDSQIEQGQRPSPSRLKKVALRSGQYAVRGVAAVGAAVAVGWGVADFSASGPGVAQKYENAVVNAVEHPSTSHRGTFVFKGKRHMLKTYEGDLTLMPHVSVYTTPTDTAYNSDYKSLDNLDSIDTASLAGVTVRNGVVVDDAVNPEGGLWVGAPKPGTNEWDWVHLTPDVADLTRVQDFSSTSIPALISNSSHN